MDFLDKRVGVICNELKKLKVKQVFPLTQWEYKEGNFIHPEDALKDEAAWENFDCKTMHWYGKDRHYWFRTTYTIPEELDGKSVWIRVSSQIDEWDDGRNPAVYRVCERGGLSGYRYEPQGVPDHKKRKGRRDTDHRPAGIYRDHA